MRLLKIDADHIYWPEFRAMVARGHHKDVVRVVIMKLWVWLAYMSEVDDYGFVGARYKESLANEFKEGPITKNKDWIAELVEAKFLTYDEERCGYWCRRFMALHYHLEKGYWAREEYLLALREYNSKIKTYSKNLPAFFEEIIQTDWFQLSMEDKKKISLLSHDAIWLIVAIDCALGLPQRKVLQYSPSILIAAISIVSSYERLILKTMLRGILQYRNSPKLPATTELILQNWEAVHKLVLGGYESKNLHNLRQAEETVQET